MENQSKHSFCRKEDTLIVCHFLNVEYIRSIACLASRVDDHEFTQFCSFSSLHILVLSHPCLCLVWARFGIFLPHIWFSWMSKSRRVRPFICCLKRSVWYCSSCSKLDLPMVKRGSSWRLLHSFTYTYASSHSDFLRFFCIVRFDLKTLFSFSPPLAVLMLKAFWHCWINWL